MNLSLDDALFYAGIPKLLWDEYRPRMESLYQNARPLLQERAFWRVYSLQKSPQGCYIPDLDMHLPGQSARTMLEGCSHVVILAATIGASFDRKLSVCQKTDMARAVLLDGLGSAAVESVCDELEKTIQQALGPHVFLSDRFSCGYGDLPLSLQQELFAKLPVSRHTGIHVLPSFMMNPSKSVTAFIGVSSHPLPARIRGCAFCSMKESCRLRKEGKSCVKTH